MKRKTILMLTVILIAWLSAGCGKEAVELPEGFIILCSFEGNKYTLKFPNGHKSANVWSSKKKAIKHAVHWKKIRQKIAQNMQTNDEPFVYESDKYEWDICR